MKKYVALLRGINVGGKNKIDMKQLKAMFEKIGHKEVVTYINSGNIIFQSEIINHKSIVKAIETAIKNDFGLAVNVIIRSQENIQKLVKEEIPNQWTNDKRQKSDVMFLWDEVDSEDVLKQLSIKPVDTVKYCDGAILWNVSRESQSKSGMRNLMGTKLYKQMTIRNVNTVRKIAALMV